MLNHQHKTLLIGIFSLGIIFTPSVLEARSKPENLDFTKGDQIDTKHDWNLGATGLRGWMWGWSDETVEARQIYITAVAPDSPADGLFQVGDVILGFNGQKMSADARKVMGQALAKADASDGKLQITIWRKSQEKNVTLRLPALGRYRDYSPYQCAKSKIILKTGCEHIANRLTKAAEGNLTEKVYKFRPFDKWLIIDCVDNLALPKRKIVT